MPVIVLFDAFLDQARKDELERGLEDLDRDLLRNGQLWLVRVNPEAVTVLLQVRKTGVAPGWQRLPPEVRDPGERFYRFRRAYRPLGPNEGDVDVPRLIVEAVRRLHGLGDGGPWVTWMENYGHAVPPPPDSHEWVRAVKAVSEFLIAHFVTNERGGWRISKAEDPPPLSPGASFPTQPIDRTAELRQALLAAGRAVE